MVRKGVPVQQVGRRGGEKGDGEEGSSRAAGGLKGRGGGHSQAGQ